MTSWFRNISIKWKTVLLIVTVTMMTLTMALGFVVYTELGVFKKSLANETRLIAKVVGDSCVADLVFGDPEEAKQTLSYLEAVPNIEYVQLFDKEAHPFAHFSPRGTMEMTPAHSQTQSAQHYYEDDKLHVILPIIYETQFQGTIYLRSSTTELNQRIGSFIKRMVILMLVLILLSGLLAYRFQSLITRPILSLANLASSVTESGDYSLRAKGQPHSRDELGILARGLNKMLEKVESRSLQRDTAEAALLKSETRFRNIIEQSMDAMFVLSGNGVAYVNPRYEAVLELDKDDVIGTPFEETGLVPEDNEDVSTYLDNQNNRDAVTRYDLSTRTRTGDLHDFEVSLTVIEWDGESAVLGAMRDVTQRKKAERAIRRHQETLNRYAQDLERSNRELNQFAYVTSHDLKAPLRAISNLSSWIEEDLEEVLTDDTRKQMDLLLGRVKRMEALIDGILEYSRVGRVRNNLEEVDVNQLLISVEEMLDPPTGFEIQVEGDMPVIETEKYRIQQIFANLLSNAIKYVNRDDGKATIRVEDNDLFYRFSVSDNGPGIAPEYHEKIFVIFQTLQARDKFESTGVGLSIVKKIIEDKGGSIKIESAVGEGTTFNFTWPKTDPLTEVEAEA